MTYVFIDRTNGWVYAPEAELGRPKVGVSEILLSRAEEYFSRFEQFSHIYSILKNAIDKFDTPLSGLAVDLGSGFGNTVIPLLSAHPDLRVLATDISPDLLAICRREALKRGLADRCAVVAFNAERDYLKQGIADAVFGCAILHHMVDPMAHVRTAVNLLKPGGRAVFLVPFEAGNAILRIAYTSIHEEAQRRGEDGAALQFLRGIARDVEVRTHRFDPAPDFKWHQMDDKWMFTRSFFERAIGEAGASEVKIEPIQAPEDLFTRQTRVVLESYGNIPSTDLPDWAWKIVLRFDEEFFSDDQKRDLPVEAMGHNHQMRGAVDHGNRSKRRSAGFHYQPPIDHEWEVCHPNCPDAHITRPHKATGCLIVDFHISVLRSKARPIVVGRRTHAYRRLRRR
ncbi:class I SAM-dependent methyltransferase [Paraburkholderia hospita]|uniref:class I SAM-dependent methyltransferase n=1 Tax=Paraburkholderia hospita TaxID=169430 RepID=UPI0002718272|nr:class I SAM-dependent methyltransferase [Paraburkholderia hospita]EUC14706.1 Methyltransferase type 11 [Burkholderia sp. BT03]SKC94040.1 Methyltransferase domain-containing protein [Paraburkholderia hospita]